MITTTTTTDTGSLKKLFHYTIVSRLVKILEAGEIKPADLYVDRTEKPVAWFSFRQDWEPTATPGYEENGTLRQITFSELVEIETPARIEIDPRAAPLDWRAWRKLSGVRSKVVKRLEEVGLRKRASVSDWRMSFEPVRQKDGHWLAIEVFVGGQWRDANEVFTKDLTTNACGQPRPGR
jgi:hypothetical protein